MEYLLPVVLHHLLEFARLRRLGLRADRAEEFHGEALHLCQCLDVLVGQRGNVLYLGHAALLQALRFRFLDPRKLCDRVLLEDPVSIGAATLDSLGVVAGKSTHMIHLGPLVELIVRVGDDLTVHVLQSSSTATFQRPIRQEH